MFFAVIVTIVLLAMLFVRQRRKTVDDSANSSSYISENKHACSGNFCCGIDDVLVIIGSTHFCLTLQTFSPTL